jgi:hypothetical protein
MRADNVLAANIVTRLRNAGPVSRRLVSVDFWRTVLVLFRRWYVVLPAVALTMGAAFAVYSSIPVRYESSSVLVLTSPRTGPSTSPDPDRPPVPLNPLLNFDQGLNTSAAIVIQALLKPELAVQLGALPGGDTTYEVNNGSINPELLITGPFVFITGESTSAAGAEGIVRRVAAQARAELASQQLRVDAPRDTYIAIDEVVPPTAPKELRAGKARSAAATLGLGAFAALAAAFAAESIAAARRERRRRVEVPVV